jgi:hypothetical protein
MKKLFVTCLILSLTSVTYAAYLDEWSNNDLCGWMDNASTPEYIVEEVLKREILCYGGSQVLSLPSKTDFLNEDGTVFPSPDPNLISEIKSDNDKSYSY